MTIRRVCDELGVTPPTIYWHVGNKQSLVDLLVDRIVGRFNLPSPEVGGWTARLRAFFVSAHWKPVAWPTALNSKVAF